MPTERLTQKPTFPVKILSKTSRKFYCVSPILRKATFSFVSGSSTGWGSMIVILSNLKCLLMRGRVPFPIDPCPMTQMSFMYA